MNRLTTGVSLMLTKP